MPHSIENALIARNVRFLLWKRGLAREQWSATLSSRLGWYRDMAENFVRGDVSDANVTPLQLSQLAKEFGFDGEEGDLRFRDMVSEAGDILGENIRYLFGSLPHGGKKALAKHLGVNQTTITRWLKGEFPPSKGALRALAAYFGLPPNVDLTTDPVFLSPEPVAEIEQRQWVRRRLEELSIEEFRGRYTALRLILK